MQQLILGEVYKKLDASVVDAIQGNDIVKRLVEAVCETTVVITMKKCMESR